MPFLFELIEWRLILEISRLLDQRKARYQVQPAPLDADPTAELIEFELRLTFRAEEVSQELTPNLLERCHRSLKVLCSLLNELATNKSSCVDLDDQIYPHLRALATFLGSTPGAVDLVTGPNQKIFALPQDSNRFHDILCVIRDCNDTLSQAFASPSPELATLPLMKQPKKGKRKWKKARVRNLATSVLGAVFERFRCELPHEVLLGLMEDPDEDSALPELQILLSRCPELDLWQEARCGTSVLHESPVRSITDLCKSLETNPKQGDALLLFQNNCTLFGTWEGPVSLQGLLPKVSLDDLIIRKAFQPLSADINALIDGNSPARFSTREKRALAVKLGFCVMDFFDMDFTSKRIYFLDSSTADTKIESPFLALAKVLPATAESHKFRMGMPHPVLLSFAKLLLEMYCGQRIELDITLDDRENLGIWAKLVENLQHLKKEHSDVQLEAIENCLFVHQRIAKALGSSQRHRRDADLEIRRKLYKKVIHKLEDGLAQCIPRSSRKRQRSESPTPSEDMMGTRAIKLKGLTGQRHTFEQRVLQRKRPYDPWAAYPSQSAGRGHGGSSDDKITNNYQVTFQTSSEEDKISPKLPRSREDFEIAILCALPVEYNAMALLVDQFWERNYGKALGDPNMYRNGRIGRANVVLVILSSMGKASAASAAASLRSSYSRLKLVLLTGVCGGVPNPRTSQELLLGDVVVSEAVVEYDHGRRFPESFEKRQTVEEVPGRLSKSVSNLVSIIKTDLARKQLECRAAAFLEHLQTMTSDDPRQATYHYPGTEKDILFNPDFRHKHQSSESSSDSCIGYHEISDPICENSRKLSCDELGCDDKHMVVRDRLESKRLMESQGRKHDAQAPYVFIGRIGSGDTVLKSGEDRDRIAKEHNILAFEMEGAGIWEEIPSIIVKGVCDYADSHKNKTWQAFAAGTAACVVKALLEQYTQADF